jgi:hypothetical protein
MKLLEAEKGVQRLIKKLETLADWARDFRSDAYTGRWLAHEIPLTPKELYGYGSVFNPLVRLFQDREVNDIDLILVTEEMNRFQRERHKWCSDNKWHQEGPCISCAKNRMGKKLSWFIDRYVNPNKLEGASLKVAIGSLERDEDIISGLIRKEQLVLLWKRRKRAPKASMNVTGPS